MLGVLFNGGFGCILAGLLLGAAFSQQHVVTAALPAAPIDAINDDARLAPLDCARASGYNVSCCPFTCTPTFDPHTEIVPVPGQRAAVALVMAFNDCPQGPGHYTWRVDWHDGCVTSGTYDHLLQVHEQHQYAKAGVYEITAEYCSTPAPGCSSCSTMTTTINVH
ncbi:hypothetical protein PTSG_08051 [Salpingoeca rosetta]|uniref:PKD domain-containing protein n=1 Tax=Salpingoeca rosetta (strain ATCC 50818 / BSB-021) TaxID=946362 RepID=F2UHV1_SALR5|nr:uncharacterized protein PTSG_08051 [Salpingoeca rosetta]EGD76700.1 hypothetical protein PTSG_08051 [Salpingoeca rosetta]|eukprot:XP_004991072.1 hypothetical protein PTSG_08051 [Salpingoeca rosetta]